jgi:hypothetical protein
LRPRIHLAFRKPKGVLQRGDTERLVKIPVEWLEFRAAELGRQVHRDLPPLRGTIVALNS